MHIKYPPYKVSLTDMVPIFTVNSRRVHLFQLIMTLFSLPGRSPGRAIVLPGVSVGVGIGVRVSKMLKFLL